jgi:precorrin-2/cobalt-factor-2 C20-methyltransferase
MKGDLTVSELEQKIEERSEGNLPSRRGRLYGIGAGPGAADLLTLRAVRLLGEVPVVFVPRGDTGDTSIALGIIRPFISDGQEVRELTAPMTRDRQARDRAWDEAAVQVLAVLDSGRDAAFLTLGDSTLYSTFFYLLEALQRQQPDLEVETVPGITSFSAAASLLGRALTIGQDGLAVVSATRGVDYLRQVLSSFENVVLLKVAPVMAEVQALLAELGRQGDAAYVCRCGMDGQIIQDPLGGVGELPTDYYSLILVRHGGSPGAPLDAPNENGR